MPILTSPPLLLNSALEPATGTVIVKVTAPIRYGNDQVTRAAAQGRIVEGVLKNAAGDGPLVLAPTPVDGPALEMWFSLNEFRDGRVQQSVSHRTVRVPFVSEVSLDDLIDVTLAAADGSYVVPQDVQILLDGITGAGDTATVAADAAVVSAAAAEVARAAAVVALESVPTLEVLSATIADAVAPKANTADVYSKTAGDARYPTKTLFKQKTGSLLSSVPLRPIQNHPTPPTIVTDAGQAQGNTGTTGTTLTGTPVNFGYNTVGKWNFLGGTGYTAGSAYFSNGLFAAASGTTPPFRIDFMFQGLEFEFAWRAINIGANAGFRVMVDGQWANTFQPSVGLGAGLRFLTKLTFTTRATRRITIEFDQEAFGGLNIGAFDTVWPAEKEPFRLMVFGDSYVLGTGATRMSNGLASQIANAFGWLDFVQNGQSGTGYLYDGTPGAGRNKLIDRIASSVTPYAPNIIIIMSGYNDNTVNVPGATEASIQAAATALYAALAVALPGAALIVTSSQSSQEIYPLEANATYTRSRGILAAAAAAPNVLGVIDLTNASSWITGTGKVGATTAAGNANVLIATDGAHPSDEGHAFYTERIKPIIRQMLLLA